MNSSITLHLYLVLLYHYGSSTYHSAIACVYYIVWFPNAVVVPFQEKKLVAEIKKTAKTGNEVSMLGFCVRCLIHNILLLDVLQYVFCIAIGCNQNSSPATSQA